MEERFRRLFGIDRGMVRPVCLFLPCAHPATLTAFSVSRLSKGLLYRCANSKDATIITMRPGETWAGDGVLLLAETVCTDLVLFGSCGAVQDTYALGEAVIPHRIVSYGTFSDMLAESAARTERLVPDPLLLDGLGTAIATGGPIKRAACATLPSLVLEDGYSQTFLRDGIEVVDMEAFAFFSAARKLQRRAIGLFYVTDVIGKQPFYQLRSSAENRTLTKAIQKSAGILQAFIHRMSASSYRKSSVL